MWALRNRTPYAAERAWVRDKDGVHQWIVAVKATFDIDAEGQLTLADEQLPPVLVPEWYGEPGKSSLKYDSDLGPMKPATDVTVLGQAHAPGGKPAESLLVQLRVGTVDKVLRVHGDRFYQDTLLGVALTSPAPFVSKPLRYEEAWGGMDVSDPDPSQHGYDPRNPVGRGFAVRSSRLRERPAHSIEHTHGSPERAGPAGFGPIDRPWMPRLKYAGTYDATWVNEKKPLLPDDYDPRYELSAPADQQIAGYLRGGEVLELGHMTPRGVLRLTLPKVYLTFSTKTGRRVEEHRSRLVTVIVEPDEQRLMLAWQTALKVAAKHVEHLDQTTIGEKPYLT